MFNYLKKDYYYYFFTKKKQSLFPCRLKTEIDKSFLWYTFKLICSLISLACTLIDSYVVMNKGESREDTTSTSKFMNLV